MEIRNILSWITYLPALLGLIVLPSPARGRLIKSMAFAGSLPSSCFRSPCWEPLTAAAAACSRESSPGWTRAGFALRTI